MLEAHDLCCVREERLLFDALNFVIQPGEIVQVEGPNGVGKTSLLRLLVGLSSPYAGKVSWNGDDILSGREEYHNELLYLGHHSGVRAELTAYENLSFYQAIYEPELSVDIWQVLAQVGLAGYEEIPAAQLSAGQQRRVALARLWATSCKLWILDEPFTAIDKLGVRILEELFVKHASQGGIVVLTTHQDLHLDENQYRKITLTKRPLELSYV